MRKTNIYSEFRIMGDTFDPNLVTQTLRVHPTETWRKGDCVYNNQGKITTLRQYTNWGYQTAVTETLDINTPIRTLQAVFADKTNTLLNLQKQYDLYFSIDIVIEVENNQPPAMWLQGFILEFAAALHARIDMDMYILEAEQ